MAPGESYHDWFRSQVVRIKPKRIGIGANLDLQTQLALLEIGGIKFVDASHWLDETRAIKDPEEIEQMRAVAKLTDDTLMAVVKNLTNGVSMNELALQIEMEGRRRGASTVSFSPFAGYMKLGAGSPNDITNVPFDRGLDPDTAICFDVGFVLNGYSSDWGRSVYWGKCPSHMRAAYRALVESMHETVAQMHDGSMRACDVYPAIESALDKRGFGDPMRRRLADHKVMGHSIGVEVHESPWLRPSSDFVLKEGMTIAIEPKLWSPGEYYLRLEEIVLVGKSSSEFLTNFDRDLFEL
jgi:Xaa-Pro aminopeptidase